MRVALAERSAAMFPVYVDPIVPGLVPAFATAMHDIFAWMALGVVVGFVAIVWLVAAEAMRERRRGRATRSRPARQLSVAPASRTRDRAAA